MSDEMLLEDDPARYWEMMFKDLARENSRLMERCGELEDLLRWRDAENEKPEPESLVLVNLIEKFAGRIPVRVMRYSERCEWIDPNAGIWMNRDVKYWRPIGPLPGEGGENYGKP